MNKLLHTYLNALATVNQFNNEEEGAEAIEWIAMVAVILILLLLVGNVFQSQGQSVGTLIIDAIKVWITKFTSG